MLAFMVRRTTKFLKSCLINSVELKPLSSFGMMKSNQEPSNDNKVHKSSRVRTRSLSELTDTEIESREVGDFNNFRISKKAIKKLKGKFYYRIKYFGERMPSADVVVCLYCIYFFLSNHVITFTRTHI